MEEIVLISDTHVLTLRNKELALAFGDIIIDTCPECAAILTIKMN